MFWVVVCKNEVILWLWDCFIVIIMFNSLYEICCNYWDYIILNCLVVFNLFFVVYIKIFVFVL